MTGPDPELRAAIAQAVGRDDTRSLARYIRDNLSTFRAELAGGNNNWRAIAQGIAARGIHDANGNAPSANAVRVAYRRVLLAEKRALPKPQSRVGRPPAPHPANMFGKE